MILNLQKKTWADYLRKGLILFNSLKTQLFRREIRSLFTDSKELKRLYYTKFPRLSDSADHTTTCISCGLCETICPTQALTLKKSKLFEIPESFTQGEVPKSLVLDMQACNKCGLCRFVCPVDAIDLHGEFDHGASIDLVQEFNQRIESSEREVQN